ncbi:MAG: nucleotide pyrophosphohydrolase [Planctomycetota bacterium]|nr:nucleotide pyrophosphohydrolase [Planctomycetota bacterium]
MQSLIQEMYGDKDEARGIPGTFMWLMEEVGELSSALRENEAAGGPASEALAFEFADVLAWLATIANVAGVDLQDAFLKKYGTGCPGCEKLVCTCDNSEKP